MDASSPEQGWTAGQINEYLDAINVPIVVCDIWSEEAEKYKRCGYFGGKPWGFGVLHSFGGHTYLHGDVRDLIDRAHEIERSPGRDTCVLFQSLPEIVDFNGFFLELAALLAWDPARVTLAIYVQRYCRLRYGPETGTVFEQVFDDLLDSVYGHKSGSVKFLLDPLYWFRLTPDLYVGASEHQEETLALRKARAACLPRLRHALDVLCDHQALIRKNRLACRDLVDIARQWLAERFSVEVNRTLDAFRVLNSAAFESSAKRCLQLLDQQSRLLATWPSYRLDVKVNRCKPLYGDDACRAVKHAHVWVYTEAERESLDLIDYYRMDLDGLVRDYYRPRVAAYLDVLRNKIATGETILSQQELEPLYAAIEKAFVAAPITPLPEGEDPITVVQDLVSQCPHNGSSSIPRHTRANF